MTEDLLDPEQATPLQNWNMPSRSGGFETREEIAHRIAGSVQVLAENVPAVEGPVIAFPYNSDHYNLDIECRDDDNMAYAVRLPISEFLEAERYDVSMYSWQVREEIRADIVGKAIKTHGNDAAWWLHLDREQDQVGDLVNQQPTEQLIIGQEGKGVRFFNYGQLMTESQQQDCKKLVELATQFFGDRTYDFINDVVIAPLDQEALGHTDDGYETTGFGTLGVHGVMFINAKQLSRTDHMGGQYDDASPFLKTMAHELGHLFASLGDTDESQLLDFARTVGWDVDRMLQEVPDWRNENRKVDLSIYAPRPTHTITRSDSTVHHISDGEYHANYADYAFEYDETGEYTRDTDKTHTGSPTEYGETSPAELSADTTAGMLLGNYIAKIMPETRDAWLAYAQKMLLRPGETEDDRPLGAVRLDAAPVIMERRTGDDILYPATALPDRIYVRAIERQGDDSSPLATQGVS